MNNEKFLNSNKFDSIKRMEVTEEMILAAKEIDPTKVRKSTEKDFDILKNAINMHRQT